MTAKREHVDGEQGGAQHRALRDTAGDIVGVWFGFAQGDMLSSAFYMMWLLVYEK